MDNSLYSVKVQVWELLFVYILTNVYPLYIRCQYEREQYVLYMFCIRMRTMCRCNISVAMEIMCVYTNGQDDIRVQMTTVYGSI